MPSLSPTSTARRARTRAAGALRVALALLIPAALAAPCAWAEEFSILEDSTFLGRDFGYPSGDPNARTAPAGRVDLALETGVFFKNLELTGFEDESIDGETFFGFIAPIRLRYRAHETVALEAGAFLGHNFGDDDELDVAEPVLRLVYEPVDGLWVIAGTLIGSHWMHDAIRDDVTVFREGAEQGVQIRAQRGIWSQDTWINWRVRETAERPEEFEVGSTTRLDWNGLRGEGQLLWSHIGGQKNTTDFVANNFVVHAGGSYGRGFGAVVEDARVLGGVFYSSDDARGMPSSTGYGWEAGASIDLRASEATRIRLLAAHFSGDDFLAQRGDPLYRFDDYTRFSAHAIFALPAGVRIETAVIGQLAGDEFVNTYLVNFVWGRAVPLLDGFLQDTGGAPGDRSEARPDA